MPVRKMKTIAILILLFANLAILCTLVPNRIQQQREDTALRTSLSQLYREQDILLDPEIIPDTVTLYALRLEEDPAWSLQAATALLGQQVIVQDDSTRYLSTYQSQNGMCTISRSGTFQAQLSNQSSASDVTKAAGKTLKAMGFPCEPPKEAQRLRAGVYTVQAGQTVLGTPVFSEGLTLTYSNGQLTEVSGCFYPGSQNPSRVSEESSITAADALVAFLSARYELGWVGQSILSLSQGYLQADVASASAVQLTPVWKLETDTGIFLINGLSGAVTPL